MYHEYSMCYSKYGKTLNWVHLWTPCLQCNNHCAERIENGRIFCTKMSRHGAESRLQDTHINWFDLT